MVLSETRKGDFEEAFAILGKKANTIPKDTFAVVLRSLGLNPTNDEVTALFVKFSGGDGVDCAGLVAAAEEFDGTMSADASPTQLQEAFAVFDKDRTGKISAAELRHTISNLGEVVDEDELDDMISDADKDGDGQIDYNEFVNILMNPVKIPPRIVVEEHLKPFLPKEKEKKGE